MWIISAVYERLTGTPWTTVHSMADQFGRPPAVEFARELSRYSDAELIARGDQILRQLRANRGSVTPLRRPAPIAAPVVERPAA